MASILAQTPLLVICARAQAEVADLDPPAIRGDNKLFMTRGCDWDLGAPVAFSRPALPSPWRVLRGGRRAPEHIQNLNHACGQPSATTLADRAAHRQVLGHG